MIPLFSHIEENDKYSLWTTLDNRRGISCEIETKDLETTDFEAFISRFETWAQNIDPRVLVRINMNSERSYKGSNCSRDEAFKRIGRRISKCQLSLETSGGSPLLKYIQERLTSTEVNKADKVLDSAFKDLENSGFCFRPLNGFESEGLFFKDAKNWVVCESFVDTGQDYRAVIRLTNPSSQSISKTLIDQIKMDLPLPFEISMSFMRLGRAESQMLLRKKIKQSESGSDHIEDIKTRANEEALEKTFLNGESLFLIELLFVLTRSDLKELKNDLKSSYTYLSQLGDVSIETFGALPSLAASLPGSPQHVTVLEVGSSLGFYLPTFESGSSERIKPAKDLPSSLSVHRFNESLDKISILSSEHLNANGIIVGASGRGKSALIGTLSDALLNDERVSMIKVDVGGSHSKECRLFGGTEYILNLNQPSGINPFAAIQDSLSDIVTRSILTNFISVLVLEDKEVSVPKKTKLEIDELLKGYIAKGKSNPCLSDFYLFAKSFSRRDLLSRWVKGGMYGNAFVETDMSIKNSERLRYYNFSEIFQASDPEFAQAGMAAVLAQFNLEMNLHPERRLVLICDETPFFIQKCFEFFKFSTANVRKFGAAVILVVQISDHLIVNEDRGIIENSFHRFLMSQDGDKRNFQDRFKLKDSQMESLLSLRSIPGRYSEFLYQFGESAFRCRLRLTPEEYWKVTTTQSDKQKIESLMKSVPELTLKEALKCLSLIG